MNKIRLNAVPLIIMALLVVAMGFPRCAIEPPDDIDITPPTTTKEYGEPYYTNGVDEWITSDTPIFLDGADDDSGVDYTEYRVWYNGEWTDWLDYTGPFTMGEIDKGKDCLHKIEYYSVDNSGNEEWWHEVMVEADAAQVEAYSALAVDPFALRTTHIVYTEEGSQDLIYEASSDFGETWTGKTVLVGGLAEASEPDIAIAPNGDIHIVFVGYLPAQQQRISHIWYNFTANGYSYDKATDPANWEARVLVDDTGRDNVYPQIATDSANNVRCVWIGDSDGVESGGAQDIFYSRFDGSGWGPRLTLYANATTTPGWPNPQITVDQYDNIHVAFLDASTHQIKYLTYHQEIESINNKMDTAPREVYGWGSFQGGSWKDLIADTVGASSSLYGAVAGMAIEGDLLHIAWQDVRGGTGQVYENTRDITGAEPFGTEWVITFGPSIDNDPTSVGEVIMESGELDNIHLFYRDSIGHDIWYMEHSSAWSTPIEVADSGPDDKHLWSEVTVDSFDGPLLTYTKATNDDAEFGIYFKKPYHNQVVRVDNTPPTTKKKVNGRTVTLEAKDNCHCKKFAILIVGQGRTDNQWKAYTKSVEWAESALTAKWSKCKTTGDWIIWKFTAKGNIPDGDLKKNTEGWNNNSLAMIGKAIEKVKEASDKGECCMLYFHFSDHGGQASLGGAEPTGSTDTSDEYLRLSGSGAGGERLSDDKLGQLIASTCNCTNTAVVIDACHSGGLIPDLKKANPNKKMEIFTSTSEPNVSYRRPADTQVFSQYFYEALNRGKSLEEAFKYAKTKIDALKGQGYIPEQDPKQYDWNEDDPKFIHCCGVGSYQIHYRLWYDGEWGPEQVGELNQPVSFELTKPCEYIIEYWAVDNLGNEEEHHSQSHTVVDHFKCYLTEGVEPMDEAVYLEDQWGGVEAMVGWDWFFCNPVEKWHDEVLTPIAHPEHHLTLYGLDYEEEPQTWFVTVDNQFGMQELTVYGPVKVAVPTQKVEPGAHEPPVCLDHFLLYKVIEGPSMDVVVGLYDQFHDEPQVLVTWPIFFANPVRKTHEGMVTEINNPEAHLVFYEILGGVFETEVQVVNQFGEQTFYLYEPTFLAVPSVKLSAEQLPPELVIFTD